MKPRKILLIVLVVLALAALMYKMSERYVYSNTVPMDVKTLLEKPELAFTEEQKGFLITTLNMKTIPPDPTNIMGTFTQSQRSAIDGVITKYMISPTKRPKNLEFVDSKQLNYSPAQKEFIVNIFTNGVTDPAAADRIVTTMNKAQSETLKKEYEKYTNYMNSLKNPVQKTTNNPVQSNIMGFSCVKSPDNTFSCSFS
jgi:hypothetical protein